MSSAGRGFRTGDADADADAGEWTELDASAIDPSDFGYVQGSEVLIVRTHWEHTSARTSCANPLCGKQFKTKLVRRDWCRRCGRIFCKDCVAFRRKLSQTAVPDPERGKPHRVCISCFTDYGEQELGEERAQTPFFKQRRSDFAARRKYVLDHQHDNIRNACVRLVKSFSAAPVIARSMAKLTGVTPEWSKVNFLPDTQAARIERCRQCSNKFSLLRLRHHCRICGDIHCTACLFSSLQVFPEGASAKVDILTPDNLRKDGSVLLACNKCLENLEDALSLHLKRSVSTSSTSSELARIEVSEAFLELVAVYPEMFALQCSAKDALKEYQRLIDTVGTGADTSKGKQSVVKTLAKHQVELSDTFTRVSTFMTDLKTIQARCERTAEKQVAIQVHRLCALFYTDHMFLFRSLKRDLSEVLPEQALLAIQSTMNAQVLNFSYMLLQQLAIECMAFPHLEPTAVALISVVDIVKDELFKFSASDEDYLQDLEDLDAVTADNGRRDTYITKYVGRPDWCAKVAVQIEKIFNQITKEIKAKGTLKDIRKASEAIHAAWADCSRLLREAAAQSQEERQRQAIADSLASVLAAPSPPVAPLALTAQVARTRASTATILAVPLSAGSSADKSDWVVL